MVNTMNPYGVGASGEQTPSAGPSMIGTWGLCECCSLSFDYETPASATVERARCDECANHVRSGSDAELLAALREDEPRILDRLVEFDELQDRVQKENKRLDAHAANCRDQTRDALQKRDRWRAALAVALAEHTEEQNGKCLCGADYPCKTLQVVERADHGLVVAIERERNAEVIAEYNARKV